jgi:hypothetical protein
MWRYLSQARLQDLLQTQELFFAHLPILEDACEGTLTARSREHLTNWFQSQSPSSRDMAYAQVDEYQKFQQHFYVNCWHMNNHESYLMWKAYADRGFAVQTTLERLQACFHESTAAVTGGVVDYVDFERDFTPVGNVFNHVATKDMPYRDERELRLVYWDIDSKNAGQPKVKNGIRIKVDLKILVHSLVRSPYLKSIEPDLERLMEANGFSFTSSAVSVRAHEA